jgi:hypothetical protein
MLRCNLNPEFFFSLSLSLSRSISFFNRLGFSDWSLIGTVTVYELGLHGKKKKKKRNFMNSAFYIWHNDIFLKFDIMGRLFFFIRKGKGNATSIPTFFTCKSTKIR